MSWSLGQTRALAVKAARGAGFAWGLAEEAGFATQWLQSMGAPGAEALVRLLTRMDGRDSAFDAAEAAKEPIQLGAWIQDSCHCDCGDIGLIRQPVLLAPFIAAVCPQNGLRLRWNNVAIDLAVNAFAANANRPDLLVDAAHCTLAPIENSPKPVKTKSRVPDTEAAAMEQLGIFAARTYAPATEQSRISGAGAGLTDND